MTTAYVFEETNLRHLVLLVLGPWRETTHLSDVRPPLNHLALVTRGGLLTYVNLVVISMMSHVTVNLPGGTTRIVRVLVPASENLQPRVSIGVGVSVSGSVIVVDIKNLKRSASVINI
jgi:hypothetical protein